MKTFTLILVSLFSFGQPMVKSKPVSTGEELQFRLSYGWFTIGRGTFKISDDYVMLDGKECLEINVEGGTAGLAGVFSRVDDRWGAIIDKDTFLPYYSYRDLSEGDYELDEKVYFDYDEMKIRFEQSTPSENKPRPTRYFDIEKSNMFDMMGGLMYARSIDYRSLKKGDTIRMDAFFDKKFYDFEMIYGGIEMIKTKVGEIYCHRVVPILEKNSVFDGHDAVTFWVSADGNRLPLKVKANMNFGTAYCELTAYKNVKSGIDFN
ncbi:MAG: DUF3108 domain-containing protein [Ekhidna sp.]|uniref:DUF3108 domain-containing protein n=1 Tax=Ekhidna sp. TaxID=2608089 RepID=UPI0032F022A9